MVGDDEREESADGGRSLLNLGHALEVEMGWGGALLHGEAIVVELGMAFRLSARLGLCAGDDARRVARHLDTFGLPSESSPAC